MRKNIIFFLSILFSTTIFSQKARQYAFTHFTSINGLSSNIVNNIIQDKQGFIWLATIDGLQRYDGNRFLTFRNKPGDKYSLPADITKKVFEDSKGNLWVWVGEKAGVFNTGNFTFSEKKIRGNNEQDPFHIRFLDEDEKGQAVIFIDKKGLYTYDEKTDQFLQTIELPILSERLNFISYHHTRGSSQFWFSSYNGMAMYDTKTKNINYSGHNRDDNKIIDQLGEQKSFVNVYGTQGDLFWFATWDLTEKGAPHFKSLNVKTGETKKYSPSKLFNSGYTEVVGILKQQNGRTWFYGQPFIIEHVGDQTINISNEYKDEQTIQFDKAYDMYEDRQHNIWVATNNGVFLFNPETQFFESYNMIRPDGSGKVDGPSICALQLNDGRVIVGSWGTGIYFYDSKFNPVPLPPSLKKFMGPYSIWCLLQQKKSGLVWMGLQGGGLIIYDPLTGKSDHFDPEIIAHSTVRQVTEDHEGNLWFGMQGGHIVKWDAKIAGNDVRKGFILIKERKNGFINKMFTDAKGFIWMASEVDGVHKYDPSTNKEIAHFTIGNKTGGKLWSNTCNDIMQYNDSLLLVAGGAINVININRNSITHITASDGLPSNTVYCFEKDNKGILWLGFAHGLYQSNLQKRLFTLYDRRDGLRSDNFFQAGAFKLKDGRMLFATEHSFVVFNPEKIMMNQQPSDPVITGFRVGSKLLPVDSIQRAGKAILQYNNTSIAIDFNSMNYTKQTKIHYQYMLEGMDKDWFQANELNQAMYNYLPPGKYTFKVRSEDAAGNISKNISEIKIKVQPPFWKTWWFLGLMIFAVIGLFIFLDKQRMQKIRATETVRTRIATSLTDDLSNSLSSINISSELAKTKIGVDAARTKEYIEQISETSNRMLQSMYDMVWSIHPKNDTMQDTIDRMKHYASEMENIYGFDVVFDIDEKVFQLKLDMEYRYELLSIFKEAIMNAARHSAAKYVQVNLQFKKPSLIMLIEDDGKGFDVDAAALNRGIADMRRRASGIHASFYIESEIHTGTIVKVVMAEKDKS